MKVNVVRIGNSRGIRIPKAVMDHCGFVEAVEMTVKGKEVILAPARKLRAGWDDAFAAMAGRGDDRLLIDPATQWDEKEWRW